MGNNVQGRRKRSKFELTVLNITSLAPAVISSICSFSSQIWCHTYFHMRSHCNSASAPPKKENKKKPFVSDELSSQRLIAAF